MWVAALMLGQTITVPAGTPVELKSATDITITIGVPPSPTTFYVSPSGNDSNPGSLSAPWRTIQMAANTVSAGSTVMVQSGQYDERVSVTRSGSSGSRIVSQGASPKPVMRGFT